MPLIDPQKRREYKAKWYRANKERCLESQKKARVRNPEIHRANNLKWYHAHREQVTEYQRSNRAKINRALKRWRLTNPEKFQAIQKRSRKANWPKHLARAAARRARKRLLTVGDLTDLAMVYARCRELRKWFDVSVDHIIPLAKGGTHEANNLQIIYCSENSLKQDKLNYKPRVIFQ
jgi:hypothetical protein